MKELNTPVASGDAIDGIQILETSDELMANDEADKQPLAVRALSLSIGSSIDHVKSFGKLYIYIHVGLL